MSRQAQRVRTLAGTLSEQTEVAVEAEYNQYDRQWELHWVDGPTVATMRTTAAAASRHLPQLETTKLHWRRGHTDLAVVAAALAHLRQHPGDRSGLRHRGDTLHRHTENPEQLEPTLLAQARYALARTARDGRWEDATDALAYLERTDTAGVAADLWLSTLPCGECDSPPSGQEQPAPVVSADMLEPELRATMRQLVDRLVGSLTGSTDGEGPRGLRRLWAAEQARHLLAADVDQRQRHTAAVECADGAGLRGLSKQLGLDASTLRKRWPDLQQEQVPPLRWLREHTEQWRAAIIALTNHTGLARGLDRDQRERLLCLQHRAEAAGWRDLIDTPETVRSLLAGLSRRRTDLGDELTQLETLLADYDTANDQHS